MNKLQSFQNVLGKFIQFFLTSHCLNRLGTDAIVWIPGFCHQYATRLS